MKRVRFFLATGHSEKSQGAAYHGTTEWQVTNEIVSNIKGSNFVIVPDGTIAQKVAFLEKYMQEGDIFIDLHLDAERSRTRRGSMIYFDHENDKGFDNASKIIKAYCDGSGQKLNSITSEFYSRFRYLGVISNGKKFKSQRFVLELGFLSNFDDLAFVRKHALKGIYAIDNEFNFSAIKALQKRIIALSRAARNYPRLKGFLNKMILKLKLMLKR